MTEKEKTEKEEEPKYFECIVQVGGVCKLEAGADIETKAKQFLYDAVSDMLMKISLATVTVRGDRIVFVENPKSVRMVETKGEYRPS